MPGSQRSGTSGFLAVLPNLDESPLYSNFSPFTLGVIYPGISDATTSGWFNYTGPSGTQSVQNSLLVRPTVFVCPSDSAQPNTTNSSPPTLSPPAATASYAMVIGSLGAVGDALGHPPATEVQQKYYNNGPFIYLLPHRTADVRDGLSTTMFVGETINGHNPETLNCWPLSVAYLSCLRSTQNPLNTPDP